MDRQPWTFPQNMTPDLRQARAMEYAAQYLDRIDQTLERIAVALEAGSGNAPLQKELQTVNGFLRQIAAAANQSRGR